MTVTRSTHSPLVEIERRVQERAKDLSIDPDDDEAHGVLETLVVDEVEQWNDDHRRGDRPHPVADRDRVVSRAMRNLTSAGPLQPLLDDDDVWEIMVNAPDEVFVRRHLGPSGYHDEVFHDDAHVVRTLTKLLAEAAPSPRKFDPSEGLQDAQLGSGARLHIVHGDLARGGHVMVNIRKFTGVVIRSLDELVARSMLTPTVAGFLRACVRARQTIVIAGAPGTGKTTLLSCCAGELDPALRVVVAEEVFEADIALPNVASMQTRAARTDRPEIDLRRLVSGFLRMAPDIAIVGEVRDREALPLLLTLSSGVKGFTTVHAGSARQALTRLRFISQLADTRSELPTSALTNLVSDAVDVVVHCTRGPDGPRVAEVACVEDLQTAADSVQFTVTDLFAPTGPDAPPAWTGTVPVRLSRRLAESGVDVRGLLDAEAALR